MRLRVRLKSLGVLSIICCSLLIYTFVDLHSGNVEDPNQGARIARITGLDLQSLGRELSESVVEDNKEPIVLETSGPLAVYNQSQLIENGSFLRDQISPKTTTQKAVIKKPPTPKSVTQCDRNCKLRQIRERNRKLAILKHLNSTKLHDVLKKEPCDQKCRLAKLPKGKLLRGGYASRVQIENITLPGSWTVTQELVNKLTHRKTHAKEVCKKYGLDQESKENPLNAWEFLINKEYGLIWCNIFKAASSTWFYNFNLLAGYSEKELLSAKETPISMARKKYPRPSVDELKGALQNETKPLSFMIARNPLERFVSAYRDKILSGSRFYASVSREIVGRYPKLSPLKAGSINIGGILSKSGKSSHRAPVPSFAQFTQYVIDDAAKGKHLNEHWTPMSKFCTPCLADFDVIAKTETMEEDGNYLIFYAGIEHVIKPKRINRSRMEPTDVVAESFLCGLTESQMDGLMWLFKYDIEIFEYDVNKYINCTRGKQ